MKRISGMLLVVLLAAPALVTADSGFYVGAGIGLARVEFDLEQAGLLPPPQSPPNSNNIGTDSFKGQGFVFKGFGGYKFFDFLALELGYVDLGDAEQSACFLNTDGDCAPQPFLPPQFFNQGNPWTVSAPINGWTLEAMGILPIAERWDLFAKVGVFFWESELTGFDEVIVAPGRPLPSPLPANYPLINKSVDGEDLTLGFGGSFDATDHISLRLEFQWFDIPDTDAVWISTFSGVYRF